MGKQSDSGLLVCHSSLILFAFSYSEPFQFPSEHLWETLLWHSVNQESLTKKELASFIHRDEKQGAATMLMMWTVWSEALPWTHVSDGPRRAVGFCMPGEGSECQFSCQAKCNKREKRPVEVFFKIFECLLPFSFKLLLVQALSTHAYVGGKEQRANERICLLKSCIQAPGHGKQGKRVRCLMLYQHSAGGKAQKRWRERPLSFWGALAHVLGKTHSRVFYLLNEADSGYMLPAHL